MRCSLPISTKTKWGRLGRGYTTTPERVSSARFHPYAFFAAALLSEGTGGNPTYRSNVIPNLGLHTNHDSQPRSSRSLCSLRMTLVRCSLPISTKTKWGRLGRGYTTTPERVSRARFHPYPANSLSGIETRPIGAMSFRISACIQIMIASRDPHARFARSG